MFKTLSLYKFQIEGGFPPDASAYLSEHEFVPCGATQAQSAGWVGPRHEGGDLIERVGQHVIAKLLIETKKVPSEVVDRAVAERCAAVERTTGRKPGKKERAEIKSDIILSLLPVAFASRSAVMVWFDLRAGILAVEATGPKADLVVTELVKAIPDLAINLINTMRSPGSAMTEWLLTDEYPPQLTADRACELKACDESKATVKYANHDVDIAEVQKRVTEGKLPVSLALTWGDEVSFVLTEAMVLKKVALLDVVLEGHSQSQFADAFDADITIITETLRPMVACLIQSLGGEFVAPEKEPT